MPIAQSLLPEFDAEMATTRRLLDRVPEDRGGFRPHEKSTSLGTLAVHIAQLPSFVVATMQGPETDMSPPGKPAFRVPDFEGRERLLALFDQNVAAARAALAAASDEDADASWTLKAGGHTILTLPRAVAWRTLAINHLIHHRGQLSVYLRLNDVPLPSIYGPTADER